ncbi:MAG TPA: glycosyltransferase [Syntrophobacteraceae bacterium]|jgi:N-acetylglucosaminyldiphosphoundecaprenol N-acetyl-beta-D-mannosaminyltransferase|nr:glycosyltransferase [Syntrophobacteraceae bacterium]HBD07543.1 glycosyltransferase [Syntrophobacteraceae bacterium]HBZ54568.1 glycosyltransferase [Syntrophobacteraceae bacterium]
MVMRSLHMLGVKITPGTTEEFCWELSRLVETERQSLVLDINVYGYNLAWQLPWMADLYNRADVNYVDGAGVVLGARMLGLRLPPRITMADFGWVAAAHFARQNHTLYLLGNPPGVAARAAEKLVAKAPDLRVLGTQHGFFTKEGWENDAVIDSINRCDPDVLMVGMGMPLEQRWVLDNHERIQTKVIWTVGAAFQYWADTIRRCPQWMGEWGLEWLFRLMLEPKRMAGRYLWGNTLFLIRALKERRRLYRCGQQFL